MHMPKSTPAPDTGEIRRSPLAVAAAVYVYVDVAAGAAAALVETAGRAARRDRDRRAARLPARRLVRRRGRQRGNGGSADWRLRRLAHVPRDVKATRSELVMAPSGAGDLQIVKLARAGVPISRGDIVVQFDGTTVQRTLQEKRTALVRRKRRSTRRARRRRRSGSDAHRTGERPVRR